MQNNPYADYTLEACERELRNLLICHNFLLECLQARKDPVDLLLILFEDEHLSHEKLVTTVLELSSREADGSTVFEKHELRKIEEDIKQRISACMKQRNELNA